jgi:hypothetical protein
MATKADVLASIHRQRVELRNAAVVLAGGHRTEKTSVGGICGRCRKTTVSSMYHFCDEHALDVVRQSVKFLENLPGELDRAQHDEAEGREGSR